MESFRDSFFLFFIFCFFLFPFILAGCTNSVSDKNQTQVYIDGNGIFPSFLAGVWKSDQNDWEIAFKPDGTIEYTVISLGRVKVVPGKITTIPMRLGGEGKFVPGQWSVRYLQEQRQLIVDIIIESFRIELGKDIIFGKARDYFSGVVSENGAIWRTERYSYPEYFVETDKYHNYPLPSDPNENPKELMVFTKDRKS